MEGNPFELPDEDLAKLLAGHAHQSRPPHVAIQDRGPCQLPCCMPTLSFRDVFGPPSEWFGGERAEREFRARLAHSTEMKAAYEAAGGTWEETEHDYVAWSTFRDTYEREHPIEEAI